MTPITSDEQALAAIERAFGSRPGAEQERALWALQDVMRYLRTRLAKTGPAVDGWVSVEDALPANYQQVQVYPSHDEPTYNFYAAHDGGTNGVKKGRWYHNDVNGYDLEMKPTHWRPLPEPPTAALEARG